MSRGSFSLVVDWIQSPWTQPFGRRDLDEDPLRLVDLPFAFSAVDAFAVADAFFARSNAAVFSLTMAAGEVREGELCGGESKRVGRRRGEQKRKNGALFRKPSLVAFITSLPSG